MPKLTPTLPPRAVQAPAPPKPVAAVKPVKQPPMPPAMSATPAAKPSPMARPPVAPTSRVVPKVDTPRGVVRTDTHNVANQHVPASAKHGKRGFKGG